MHGIGALFRFHAGIKTALGFACVNSVMEILWNRLAPSAWDMALAPHGAPMPQHATYGAVAELAGRQVLRAEVLADGGIVAYAQILRRGPITLLSRGPVWAGAPDARLRRRVMRALGAAQPLMIATTETAEPGAGLPLITPRHVAQIDLAPEPATLRAAMAPKWRNRLVAAEAERLDIARSEDPETVDWLLKQEEGQRQDRGYRALPAGFVRAWALSDPDGIRLWVARRRGEPVAAMLFLLHRPWASYHVGWSGVTGRAVQAHPALLWAAMQQLRDEGIARLDLGDVDTEASPGLARFKIGTGAMIRPLGPTILLPPLRLRR